MSYKLALFAFPQTVEDSVSLFEPSGSANLSLLSDGCYLGGRARDRHRIARGLRLEFRSFIPSHMQ